MITHPYLNALGAALHAEKEKNAALTLKLEFSLKQRDNIKEKWELLQEELTETRNLVAKLSWATPNDKF